MTEPLEIEFLCHPDDLGVIPEPFPARKLMPEWYKALPPKINNEVKLENSTLKRCPPFIDAMSVGWIIPLAADVEFVTNEDASGVTYKSMFYRSMIENHSMDQISHPKCPNPALPKPPMKFMNHWAIRVPKGYSVMFVPPLNRPESRFTCFSGIVDCDGYFEFVNFPFLFNTPNFTGILEAGTPLVQMIPFKRDSLFKDAKIGAMTAEDFAALEKTRRQRKVSESYYRNKIWTKK